jgi:peptidoglycan biosynthesis protein MviN/MurJ (putative lipid II flippase)
LRIPVAFKILPSEETFNAAYIPIFSKISEGSNSEKNIFSVINLLLELF